MSAAARSAPWNGLASRRLRLEGPWLPLEAAAVAAVLATLAVPLVPRFEFAYNAPSLRVALDTGIAVIGLLATAIVVRGRRDDPRFDQLAIAAGLAVIAVTGAVLATLLAVAPGSGPRGLIALTGTFAGAVLLAAGAFLPARRPRHPRPAALAAVAIALGAIALVAWPASHVVAQRQGAEELMPMLSAPAAELALQLVAAGCFAVAALGLTGRGIRGGDSFARRLGLAVLFFAFAKFHYALVPPVGHEWVHIGDLMRVLFCTVLLWAAVLELAAAVSARAAERERRRIARDLHDGVAQELAFIRRRAARIPEAEEIAVAAERALLDSRRAIEHLAAAPDEPLERALERHAAVIAARTGVAVTFASSGAAHAGAEVREALARILGEAVANARHGGATRVSVELSAEPLRLRVADDGKGFDPAGVAHGFGIGAMTERAAQVGARLSVRSGPGAGTEVAVELR